MKTNEKYSAIHKPYICLGLYLKMKELVNWEIRDAVF